jgi:putative hydrolase
MSARSPTNKELADLLEQIADLLDSQEANRFRVEAYQEAAGTVRTAENSIAALAHKRGQDALQELPNIGTGIARVIHGYVMTGRSEILERLQGESAQGAAFKQVPGIGKKLARRIAEELNISTLEELEQAAHDGRLEKVEGFGSGRIHNLRVSLAGLLSSAAQRSRRQAAGEKKPKERPEVETLLEVDKEYRRKAKAGKLRKIAPKRFNPEGEAWLPVLHTEREEWDFTALYSNTKRAHDLEKTDDWVVLYYQKDGQENQVTVVTETQGALEGRRVVRGLEEECRKYYSFGHEPIQVK